MDMREHLAGRWGSFRAYGQPTRWHTVRMPASKKPAAGDASVDPNKLIRRQAGTYRTADERFEVRQAGVGWFLVDSSTTDDLGLELTRGPFPTLKAVSEALPDARRTTLKPLPRRKSAASSATSAAKATAKTAAKSKPAPPPPSWIDRLPKEEASAVRRLVKALSLEGVAEAEELVRADRRGQQPAIAQKLLERRLDDLVDNLPDTERDTARRIVQRVVEVLTVNGTTLFDPLPGWALVEVGPQPEPPNRRISLRPKRR